MSGTGFAHLLGIAVYPVLTRIYTPDEIGLFATYIAFFSIYAAVATLRYEYATLIPRSEHAANNITFLAGFILLCSSLLLMLLLLLFGDFFVSSLNMQKLGGLIYLLPATVFCYSAFMIMTFSMNRHKAYGGIATGKITASSSIATFQIGLGLLQLREAGLILGKVAGDSAGLIWILWRRAKLSASVRAGVTPHRMMAMARRYRNFPKFNAPHALTTTVSNNFPVLLFNTFIGEAVAGFYAIAHKICYSPVQVIGQATYQVFGRRVAEKYGEKEAIIPFFKSTLLLLAGVGFLPFLVLFIISPMLFAWLLGPGWEMTGEFVQILTPFIFLVFVVSPFHFIPLMLDRQRKAFVIDVLYLLVRLAALGTGIWYGSAMLAVLLYALAGIMFNLYMIGWIYTLVKRAEEKYLQSG